MSTFSVIKFNKGDGIDGKNKQKKKFNEDTK